MHVRIIDSSTGTAFIRQGLLLGAYFTSVSFPKKRKGKPYINTKVVLDKIRLTYIGFKQG